MKKILLLIVSYSCYSMVNGQSFKKYPIGNSGCSAYFYCDPGAFDISYSEDSSKLFTAECISEEIGYGLICVRLFQENLEIAEAEGLMINYLDYLKTLASISSAAGYGKGHRLRGKENIHGVIDYWKDEKAVNWKVKGWTDGKFITILYVKSIKEINENKANLFLDGIVLKGM